MCLNYICSYLLVRMWNTYICIELVMLHYHSRHYTLNRNKSQRNDTSGSISTSHLVNLEYGLHFIANTEY